MEGEEEEDGELDIFTGLISFFVELLTDECRDGPDHGHVLVPVLSISGPRHLFVNPNEIALTRMTREIAEIFPKVVIACGTRVIQQSFWEFEVCL